MIVKKKLPSHFYYCTIDNGIWNDKKYEASIIYFHYQIVSPNKHLYLKMNYINLPGTFA